MGKSEKPKKSIEQLIQEDGRYPLPAVQFVREGLSRTVENQRARGLLAGSRRHVSGAELSDGLREVALDRWGMLARMVLQRWNITNTRDFGEIVFLLVENGWMQKEPQDQLDDFDDVYDFTEAFDNHFELPEELE